ncbi:ABC transporter ATP-binding protein [Ruminiclostridium cellobioparum]|uniref:ABC-type multidrug transport system, ATPase component n=1 Tax=Ruminiclostridium cellobioparum subsp. termitidis CT1112 TaxID=1195236 RepID=S0FI69_RUMCE|nr:ABC transporter ATP-binding protein [Ruminiclostridium cellobioparum]EMS71595.1 ABC-type multidrug transport system, ATPase component [Ruminiclostridium cellobioparum subsp. termitidis CT1112]
MDSIIKVENLEKSYKKNRALDGISFDVHAGEILCLLGPNGAGKSTTINILTTALKGEKGNVFFKGRNINQIAKTYKQNLGIVPQELALYEELSAERNVEFFAALYGVRGRELRVKVNEALKFVGLWDRKKDRAKTFSGGMKRRLNIACAIAHNPKIIILDEPTVGIDPQSRNHILKSIKELRENGATIIYTTHYMEEVEEISTRIIIIDHGKIIAEGTKESLKEKLAEEKQYIIEADGTDRLEKEDLYKIAGVKNVDLEGNRIRISVIKGIDNLDKIISILIGKKIKINNVTNEEASLETVFLKLTGRTLRN